VVERHNMAVFSIPIDGIDIDIELHHLEHNKLELELELDGYNPRISFLRDNQVTSTLNEEQIVFAIKNKKLKPTENSKTQYITTMEL
jgi:hypothetical protein